MLEDDQKLVDLVEALDKPEAEFEIRCKKCGSTKVKIDDSRAMGSSWTGPYGSLDLVCQQCGATKTLAEY